MNNVPQFKIADFVVKTFLIYCLILIQKISNVLNATLCSVVVDAVNKFNWKHNSFSFDQNTFFLIERQKLHS
jgi:hypothetical protein